jgi:hypothetical protein
MKAAHEENPWLKNVMRAEIRKGASEVRTSLCHNIRSRAKENATKQKRPAFTRASSFSHRADLSQSATTSRFAFS